MKPRPLTLSTSDGNSDERRELLNPNRREPILHVGQSNVVRRAIGSMDLRTDCSGNRLCVYRDADTRRPHGATQRPSMMITVSRDHHPNIHYALSCGYTEHPGPRKPAAASDTSLDFDAPFVASSTAARMPR